ncbi:MAG: proton-conducting transporter membrane subunit, partial [Pseudomonadota bacterium]
GYLMVGMVAARHVSADPGMAGILFYLIAYILMNLGAFIAVTLASGTGRDRVDIASYAGMGFQHPLLAAALAVCMFSLAGIPLTAGFMGKFYVFGAAIKIGYVGLAIIAVLNSVLSFYYYLRVVVVLYMFEKSSNDPCDRFSLSAIFALAIAVAGTLLLGVAPGSLMAAAMAAAAFIP